MDAYTKRWIQDRHDSMLSLDKEKIESYCIKYGVNMPKDETTFWIGVHKTITALPTASEEEKRRSRDWLEAHSYSPLG